jgi:hypothetical protein
MAEKSIAPRRLEKEREQLGSTEMGEEREREKHRKVYAARVAALS